MTVQQNHRFISNYLPQQTDILHIGGVKKQALEQKLSMNHTLQLMISFAMMKPGFHFHLLKSLGNVRMKRENPFFSISLYLKQLLRVIGFCWVNNLLENKGSDQIKISGSLQTILMINSKRRFPLASCHIPDQLSLTLHEAIFNLVWVPTSHQQYFSSQEPLFWDWLAFIQFSYPENHQMKLKWLICFHALTGLFLNSTMKRTCLPQQTCFL